MKIEIEKLILNDLLVYAFRYALGRSTYAVADMVHYLIMFKEYLNPSQKDVIIRDIERALETNNYGMEMDKPYWESVLVELGITPHTQPK